KLGFALLVFFGGAEATGLGAKQGGAGSVNGLAVDGQPVADLMKALDLLGRHTAVRVGPNVQQIVATLAGNVDEIAQQRLGGFEVMVVRLESPRAIHGHARLPIASGISLRRYELLGCVGISP